MIQVTLRRSFSFRLLASIVAGIICIPGFAYAQRPMPIENGVLRTDLDAATFSINNATNVTASGNFIGNLTGNANTANSSTNASYSTNAGNATIGGNGNFNGTFTGNGSGLSLPGNLVYTDIANQTITGNLTVVKGVLGDPTNELYSNLAIKASGLSYTGNQANYEYNGTGYQSYTNTLSAQPSLSGVVIVSDEYTSDGGIQDYKTTLKVSPYELKLSAQDAQNAITSDMTLTYGGLVLPQSVSSSTGNLAVNGTNLTFDTGDININGGDITNISNLTGTAGLLTIGNGTSIVNASFIGGAGGLLNYLEFTGFVGFRNNSGNYARLAANSWSISTGPYDAAFNTNGASETLNNTIYSYNRGWVGSNKEVMQLSGTNLTLSITNVGATPTADFFIYKSSVAIAANRTLTLPNTIVATDSIVSGNTTFNGTITLAQRTNHTVNSVAGGGNITNTMSFARVTSTGNVTVFDGASGDWITVKNNSGGVITLLSADTFDGNASISLNNNEAVSLTSTGTDWMIH